MLEKGEGGKGLESTVAALLLVTSTVVLACIVVGSAVDMVQQYFGGANQAQLVNQIQTSILNQTSLFNSTLPVFPMPTPTPAP
jgi:hypothetical protein